MANAILKIGLTIFSILLLISSFPMVAEANAIGWDSQTTIRSPSPTHYSDLKLIHSQNGIVATSWVTTIDGNSEVGIAFSSDHTIWTSERTIDSVEGSISNLNLISLGDGSFLMAWIRNTGQQSSVCACFVNITTTWGKSIGLDQAAAWGKSELVMDAQPDGLVMLAWIQEGWMNNFVNCTYYDRLSGWKEPFNVYDRFPEVIESIDLTLNGKGDCLFVIGLTWFGSNSGTYSRLWNSSNGFEEVLQFGGLGSSGVSAKFVSENTAVCVWSNGLWVSSSTFRIGQGWDSSFFLNFHDGHGTENIMLATDGNGSAAASWTQMREDGDGHNIYVARYELGSGWEPTELGHSEVVDNSSNSFRMEPQITFYGPSLPIVVWCEWKLNKNGSLSPSYISYNRYTPENGWGGPKNIIDIENKIWIMGIVSSADLSILLMWSETDDLGLESLESKRYSSMDLPPSSLGLIAEGGNSSIKLTWEGASLLR